MAPDQTNIRDSDVEEPMPDELDMTIQDAEATEPSEANTDEGASDVEAE
jgi:hypothetical protein